MQLTFQEMLLLLMVLSALVIGVSAVYKSTRHMPNEKVYWYLIVVLFNVLGLAAFLLEYVVGKRKRA